MDESSAPDEGYPVLIPTLPAWGVITLTLLLPGGGKISPGKAMACTSPDLYVPNATPRAARSMPGITWPPLVVALSRRL